jgi:hypothetical protein
LKYRLVAAYEGGSSEKPPVLEPDGVRRPTVVNLPKAIWMQLTQPLRNFGYGRRSMWEGGVGLFIMVAGGLLMLVFAWIKGQQVRSRSHKYTAVVEFQQACGITVGTPVRIRGVDVGQAVKVKPSLAAIDVVVELQDEAVVIPRNALVEVNQSGLISETLIDITPRHPIPAPRYGPLDAGCEEEGVIVCDRHRIKGEQGVSLDELVGICTKIAKQMDAQGIDKVFETAETVKQTLLDTKPLLKQIDKMAEDVGPLLKEVREGKSVTALQNLMVVATSLSQDIRRVNNAVLTDGNLAHLRDSVKDLTGTLKNIETISQDLSGFLGDPVTKYNLKQVIETLGRLVED